MKSCTIKSIISSENGVQGCILEGLDFSTSVTEETIQILANACLELSFVVLKGNIPMPSDYERMLIEKLQNIYDCGTTNDQNNIRNSLVDQQKIENFMNEIESLKCQLSTTESQNGLMN